MARKSKKSKTEDVPPEEVEETEQDTEQEDAPAETKSRKSKKSKSKKDKKSKKEKKEKKSKKSKKSKKAAEPEPEPVEEAEAETEQVEESAKGGEAKEAEPAVEKTPVELLQESSNALFTDVIASIQARIAADKALLTSVRGLQRQLNKERKEVAKVVKKLEKSQRKRRRSGNKTPGGFAQPTPLSPPLCDFLGVPQGTELPRTEVTKRITSYVKEKSLQNPEMKKQILPDPALKSLLGNGDDDEVTYFNLQRYMKVHFLKKNKETGEIAAYVPHQAVQAAT
jgi:chromatin remodeling complex protein RSC6